MLVLIFEAFPFINQVGPRVENREAPRRNFHVLDRESEINKINIKHYLCKCFYVHYKRWTTGRRKDASIDLNYDRWELCPCGEPQKKTNVPLKKIYHFKR